MGNLSNSGERGMSAMPVRGLFVGEGDGEEARFGPVRGD
jgi:hypothetical protein